MAVMIALSGCSSTSAPIPEQPIPSSPAQTEVTTVTPSPIYTQPPTKAFTPSVTNTSKPKVELTSSSNPTPTLLPYTPSLSSLQIINRTNVAQIVPIWRYEPKDNRPENWGSLFAFSPDSKTIALAVDDHIEFVSIETGQVIQKFFLDDDNLFPKGWTPEIQSLAFSPGGKQLAALTWVGPVLWDVTTGKGLWTVNWGKIESSEIFTSMAFSPGGDMLITTSITAESATRFWSTKTGEMVKALDAPNQHEVVFNADGTRMYTVDRLDWIWTWDTSSWEVINIPNAPVEDPITISISPNGKVIAVNSGWNDAEDGEFTTELYLAEDWKRLGRFVPSSEKFEYYGPTRLKPSFNLDGGILAFAIGEAELDQPRKRPYKVELWNTSLMNRIAILDEQFPTPITQACFSPDGRLLVARSENGTAVFWGIPTLQ